MSHCAGSTIRSASRPPPGAEWRCARRSVHAPPRRIEDAASASRGTTSCSCRCPRRVSASTRARTMAAGASSSSVLSHRLNDIEHDRVQRIDPGPSTAPRPRARVRRQQGVHRAEEPRLQEHIGRTPAPRRAAAPPASDTAPCPAHPPQSSRGGGTRDRPGPCQPSANGRAARRSAAQARIASTNRPSRTIVMSRTSSAARTTNASRASAAPAPDITHGGPGRQHQDRHGGDQARGTNVERVPRHHTPSRDTRPATQSGARHEWIGEVDRAEDAVSAA